ncbi:MAG: c-type cytochrome [Niabella sp.]
MTSYKHIINRLTLIIITLFAVCLSSLAQDSTAAAGGGGIEEGKKLFVSKCQACHSGDMKSNSTGPALGGVESQWPDKEKLHEWIRNNVKLTASGYPKAVEVSKLTPTVMNAFDDLSDTQIDDILGYIDAKASGKLDAAATSGSGAAAMPQASTGQNTLVYGIITLILALVAVVLIFVNNNLVKVVRDTQNNKQLPSLPFYRNKTYLATAAILLFILGGYLTTKALININRQIHYEPTQPIYYSHKVHAGINQISCLYCHGNAWESKTAAIPSTNVCMNCHKTIQKYTGDPLFDSRGNQVDGTAEIQKMYKYAGFDPQNAEAWDASKAQSIPWVKIHNLPDHVYFNHSQHVRVGNVQCQTCHGEITAMDEVKQFSELSMGWCVNCHRQTKVNFNIDSTGGNKYYSIYEKFHNDIKAGKMDSVTVKDIGGLECQKCHY